ncbi:MAG TPA: dockerin type I domain-containing protein, partial [Phycisphaerae bacterium]|nr:dockerin type I domain-containing protein [Phycisphaerae bacterium]
FADYCSVQIWTMPAGSGTVTEVSSQLDPSIEGNSISNITSFGEDAAGEVYIVGQSGDIFRITVDCTPGPGDENADCRVNVLDVPIFVNVLLGNDLDSGHIARADVNGDSLVNGNDIGPFTHLVVP